MSESKRSRPEAIARSSNSGSPGSKKGGRPADSSLTFASSTSTPTTWWPRSAMHAACTAPRYPHPMTEMNTRRRLPGHGPSRGVDGPSSQGERRATHRDAAGGAAARVTHMRFGLFVPQGWRLDLVGIAPGQQWQTMLDVARLADDGPFESIWVYDHFHTVPVPTEEATHEAWTLMAAFAAATSRVRLGQMCTCMSYRNPAYLAKVAATVDIVSGGRTEMGIGGGWYEHEWRAYGYGFPAAKERLGRLREGVEIMHQAWTGGYATLNGTYYQVDGARVWPKPLQENGIPLWIAGGGEKVTLRIAARYAQY